MQYEVAGGECRVVAGPAVVTSEAVCSEACSSQHRASITQLLQHTTQGPGGGGQVELLDPGKGAPSLGPG